MTRIAFALLLGLAACPANGPADAGSPEPTGAVAAGDVKLEFSARVVESGTPSRAGVTAEGGAGRIVVRGQLDTPNPCQRVSATVGGGGRELTLRVESARTGDMCVASIANFTYDATLTGLAAGTYRLRVVHVFPETGWETPTALDQSVLVR